MVQPTKKKTGQDSLESNRTHFLLELPVSNANLVGSMAFFDSVSFLTIDFRNFIEKSDFEEVNNHVYNLVFTPNNQVFAPLRRKNL